MHQQHNRTFLALVIGVRIASTITISSGLSRAPAKAPAEAERCEPILSIRRAGSMASSLVLGAQNEAGDMNKYCAKLCEEACASHMDMMLHRYYF